MTIPRPQPEASRLPIRLLVALAVLLATALMSAAPARSAPGAAARSGDQPSFDTIANLDELTSDHARIFRLYWAFFGREPDPGGALYWIEQHDNCLGLAAIADLFAASDEFAARYPQLDDASFVGLMYRNVLGRPGDQEGMVYWSGRLSGGHLTRGGVVLNVSLSAELTGRHRYPSDGVPPRGCQPPPGSPEQRGAAVAPGEPLATVAGLTIRAPAARIEHIGFHQSTHPGALGMTPAGPASLPLTTMASRGRGTDRRGALDIATEPSGAITAPLSGTVARAGSYTLYCRYRDGYVVINPDGRPDLEVKLLHIRAPSVRAGQRVAAGDVVAAGATPFPFRSQIDDLTPEPSWPHVHIEVVDPSIPRRPGGGGC